ncbi:hypothetical protein F5Y17DRAFT_440514 [Xylariaceae sp. FL0594]|nr:hypothetical protein F5Y17DRAFT_440514 [Xylariaceae sp. FL0594]
MLGLASFDATRPPHLFVVAASTAAALLLPPAAYAVYVLYGCVGRTSAHAGVERLSGSSQKGVRVEDKDKKRVSRLGGERGEEEEVVAAYENVTSERVALPIEKLAVGRDGEGEMEGGSGRGVLETYLSTTMRLFTLTPQAHVMRSMVARLPNQIPIQVPSHDGSARTYTYADTFSAEYLRACRFRPGDRVCGIYKVRERVNMSGGEGEYVTLDISPPEGWNGPVVHGYLNCGVFLAKGNVQEVAGCRNVRFFNQSVMVRALDEKPTLLEGRVGRLLHTLMVRWMVVRGVDAVVVDGGVVQAKAGGDIGDDDVELPVIMSPWRGA